MILEERKKQLQEDFDTLPSWDERFAYLIDLGRQLPDFPKEKRTSESFVSGCQSRAWLSIELNNDKLSIMGDAEGLITKGMIALLSHLYSGATKEEIKKEDFSFFQEIGLLKQLSTHRANGLSNMIQKIKHLCL